MEGSCGIRGTVTRWVTAQPTHTYAHIHFFLPHLVHLLPKVDLAGHELLSEALVLVLQSSHCFLQADVLLLQTLLRALCQCLGLQQGLILFFKLLQATLIHLCRKGEGWSGGGGEGVEWRGRGSGGRGRVEWRGGMGKGVGEVSTDQAQAM